MNGTQNTFPAQTSAVTLAALTAAAAVTLGLFQAVVSLADDEPMAIAGKSGHRMLAQQAKAADEAQEKALSFEPRNRS